MVARRAGVAVGAGHRVVGILAAHRRVAGIGRAGVVVVAATIAATLALSALADVARRARVAVVTRRHVDQIRAARNRVTGIRRADVAVVARQRRRRSAGPAEANVVLRARVAIGAGVVVGRVGAARLGVAIVGRAGVVVIAAQGRPLARATRTLVAGRAGVVVVARVGVVHELAALQRVAGIGRAGLVVVADLARTAALAVAAGVARGANVAVVAVASDVGVDASAGRTFAGVERAGVVVVTVLPRAGVDLDDRHFRCLLDDIHGGAGIGSLRGGTAVGLRSRLGAAANQTENRDNGRNQTGVGRHLTVFHDTPVQKLGVSNPFKKIDTKIQMHRAPAR